MAANEIAITLNHAAGALPEDLDVPLMFGDRKEGTGPYRLVESTSDRVVLESFKQYQSGRPGIDRVVIQPYKTLRLAWTSLLRDDVDMVTNVPPDAVEFIGNDRIAVTSFPRVYQYVMAFNSQRSPLSSRVVRRALNLAVDRQRLLTRVLGGRGLPATGPLWPQHWAIDKSVRPYAFDPQQAEKLLDDNGFRRAVARKADGRQARFSFTCLLPANFSIEERFALEVQQELYNIGVDVQFEALPLPDYTKRLLSGDFDAALVDLVGGPTFGRPYGLWHSARDFKVFNVFGYENVQADRLFTVLRETRDESTARAAARRLQEVFLDDPPALFLAWNERARAVSRNFQVVQDPGRDPVLTLWRWTARPAPAIASAQ